MTPTGLAKWTGAHSVYGEMIFQMLSRGTYTFRQIAEFIGCPVEAVEGIARRRERQIERNHGAYLAALKTCRAVLASSARTGYPARPSFCVREFLRSVGLFGGSFRSARTTGAGEDG